VKVTVILHTLVSYFLLVIVFLVLIVPAVFLFLMPKSWRYKSRFFAGFLYWAYWLILKCILVPITFKGMENIPAFPVIIAANHQSSMDVPLVGILAQSTPHIWLAWSELFERPFHYFVLSHVALPLDTASPLRAMRSFVNVLSVVCENNMHAIIFPEGGRFTDGQVHDFFAGFVMLAKKTGRPVVPVRIFNVQKVYPPQTFFAYWYPITVVVGKPMYMKEDESDEQFKDRVHQWFLEQTEG
jgi:1-acyl-sn-glycerol-3-phosphate acyltransferase